MSDDDDVVFDQDNPEWTDEDFARALPPEALPPHILAAFPNTRINPTRKVVAVPVDDEVLRRFGAKGPDWRQHMSEALRKAVGL